MVTTMSACVDKDTETGDTVKTVVGIFTRQLVQGGRVCFIQHVM